MSDHVAITINGVALQARPGQMLIEVADAAGIYIPRFCYHNKLSVAANCRMCLVEAQGNPKPLPACATPVAADMVINTTSAFARRAQKNVMEMLLINHPLDCPICDQGGECELQDLAMGYGRDSSAFVERKRVVKDKDIGPLISTELTRCIHCTRCVRFGEEVAGLRELGMTGRGMHALIGTYVENTVDHELSGNVIDLCPVGALTAKPSRFGARAWEVRQTAAVAPHDAVGSNIYIHAMRGRVERVVPRQNEAINEVWLSDRDRFSYEGAMHAERAAAPMLKGEGRWRESDWPTALDAVVAGIERVIESRGVHALGAWVSPRATLEEMYLLQGIVRHLGSDNIDHRLLQTDFRGQGGEPRLPSIGAPIAELEKQDAVLVVGANTRKEQPIIAHKIRKAALAGAKVSSINPRDFDPRCALLRDIIVHPAEMVSELAAVAMAAAARRDSVKDIIFSATVGPAHKAIADSLQQARRGVIVTGQIAAQHPDAAILSELARAIAEATDCALAELPAAANSVGAWQAGVLPHRGPGGVATGPGQHFRDMLEAPPAALIMHGIEPEHDCADPVRALAAAEAAEFTVALTPYVSERMREYADVILPIAPYTETDGSYINMEGLAQSFTAATRSHADSSPAWKVYRVLGQRFGLDRYEYETAAQVLTDALQATAAAAPADETPPLVATLKGRALIRSGEVSIYATDNLVRRAASLQRTADAAAARVVCVNPATAERLGITAAQSVVITQDRQAATLALRVREGIADDVVWLPLIPELGALNRPARLEAA